MNGRFARIGIVVFVVLLLAVGVAAQNKDQPHAIFQQLKVGQMIDAEWIDGGWEVRNYGGVQKIEAIGPDYLTYSDRGKTYTMYISLIKVVVIR